MFNVGNISDVGEVESPDLATGDSIRLIIFSSLSYDVNIQSFCGV